MMNNLEFSKIYLDIINNSNDEIILESWGKTLAGVALAGSALLGAGCSNSDKNAQDIENSSSQEIKMTQQINNSSKQKVEQTALPKKIQLSEDELFIAKTIYSEASTICTYEEHLAIGNIIQNRMGHPGFGMGRLKSAIDVVKQPAAFSSVLKHNVNWDQYEVGSNSFTKFDAKLAKTLIDPSKRLLSAAWMKDIVYYHDKSIDKPSAWDNRYWTSILVKETEHFKFYKVKPAKPKKSLKKSKKR